MISSELKLPKRQLKPRTNGMTILIDNGVPLNLFKDTIQGSANYIDFVKFGWGTSLITKYLEEKISCLKQNDVQFFFGGTLFEKFLSQDKIEDYYRYCQLYGCEYVEISNGTISLSNKEKASFITDFSKEFCVFSEVGSKDSTISNQQESSEWIDYIIEDLEAGSKKVMTETREGGTSGLCNSDGEMRSHLIEEILRSGIQPDDLIFEAPTKVMQTYFIEKIGPNANLANIPFQDAIPLETLRLGLRSDTFYLFE
ncbi:phosphosulfolactate synthase [Bacillus sp. CLL-7-23]|uniref:Phosphosulfolactate synthase n=1 Tax=Bacillus changyiensis TaxID=3004103 RepID=A0ABT4X9H0_9BACI|nr:phosphosulfolactate synthase [Bacillus changyiensis]MDA7027997.1 phosphosulfolactate synthase [Bacillus changyiensis]